MNVCEGTNERPRDANVGTRERWVTFLPRVMKMEINGSSRSRGLGQGGDTGKRVVVIGSEVWSRVGTQQMVVIGRDAQTHRGAQRIRREGASG